jgi:cysteine synthase
MDDATPDKAYTAARFKRSGRGKIYDSVLDLIGDTPLVRLPHLTAALKPKAEVVAKLEFFNPLASVKDRIGVAMVEWLEATGLKNSSLATTSALGFSVAVRCGRRTSGVSPTVSRMESKILPRPARRKRAAS